MEKGKTGRDALRKKEIAIIQMGKSYLKLQRDEYEALLAGQAGGKTSSTELTWQERRKVIDRMKELGFVIQSKRKDMGRNEDQVSKLRAMWHALAAVEAVTKQPTVEAVDAAIEAWALRMLTGKVSALRFASSSQMQQLIEQMKKWCVRVGAELE